MFDKDIPASLHRQLHELRNIELLPFRKQMQLSKERFALLQSVVRREKEIENYFVLLDIHLFCLKAVFPNEYHAANVKPHEAATQHIITYDPPKNGQNVIKHGLSFSELYTFSPEFGALLVPCPSEADGERIVIFSKLVMPTACKPDLPTPAMEERTDLCTVTIALSQNQGFRVISSRAFHQGNWDKVMNSAIKGIYTDEPEKKREFVQECQRLVENDLFGDSTTQAAIRLIRPVSAAGSVA